MAKDFIVAIELGSSKITGIAGKKNPDGSITVLSVAKEDSKACMRKGVVYNIDKTAQALTNIINKLKGSLQTDIARVYVGVGGQSLKGVKNVVVKDLPADSIVTQDIVNELMDTNRNMKNNDYEVLDAITQEYKVDMLDELNPVGVQACHIEGNFLNLLWRKTFNRSLNKCFDNAGIPIVEMYVTPLAMAEEILTEAEKCAGCMLVDLGADTTTVAIYTRDILRHLFVLPLGSNNITKDLTTLKMEEREAEAMKLKYASAYTEVADIDDSMVWAIDNNRSVNSRLFIDVVEARVLEIIANVWYLVPTEYTDKLLGGIILTGGGSNLKNIDDAFRRHTHIDKVRIAKFLPLNILPETAKISIPHDGTMNGVISILLKGNMNCAGNDLNRTLFDDDPAVTPAAGTAQNAQQGTNHQGAAGTPAGTTPNANTQNATPDDPADEDEDDTEEDSSKDGKPRKNIFNKAANFLKKFGNAIIEEEK